MTHPNASTALARVVIDELARGGISLVVLSPGSRSGALAIAASEHPEIDTVVMIDERSAAFLALGAARGMGAPAAVVSTSGSAAAHFFPAIVEADMSCVPLVCISADRPRELQGVGANQTIHQPGMFGAKVREAASIEAPDSSLDRNQEWRRTVARLVSSARGSPPGPAHLNVRFREPTVPVTDDGRVRGEEYPFETPRVDTSSDRHDPGPVAVSSGVSGGRGVVIAGDGDYDRKALSERASELGWPVLATALSGMRGGEVVAGYHHILSDGIPVELTPETVVAVGAIGPSSRLETLIAAAGERVRVDSWGRTIDPGGNATRMLHGDVAEVLRAISTPAPPGWSEGWKRAEADAGERTAAVLGASGEMSGALVASSLNEVAWQSLVVSSSLPIREIDAHLRRPGPVFANRGASGIDGFVSTALGVAFRRPGTLALSGDLSLLHDDNGFIHDGRIDLVIVVVDNQGGGLFDSLPQATHAADFERLFVAKPDRDLEDLARFHRLGFAEARSAESLIALADEALHRPGIDLIRVPVDRGHDLDVRSQLGS